MKVKPKELPKEFVKLSDKVSEKEIHRPMIDVDSVFVRDHFIQITDLLDDDTKALRREKMGVYGLSFAKNGWDSIYENVRRKYDSMTEVLFRHILLLRKEPSDKQLVYLYDAMLDLKNYSTMAMWFLIAVYGERLGKLKGSIKERRQT